MYNWSKKNHKYLWMQNIFFFCHFLIKLNTCNIYFCWPSVHVFIHRTNRQYSKNAIWICCHAIVLPYNKLYLQLDANTCVILVYYMNFCLSGINTIPFFICNIFFALHITSVDICLLNTISWNISTWCMIHILSILHYNLLTHTHRDFLNKNVFRFGHIMVKQHYCWQLKQIYNYTLVKQWILSKLPCK